MKSKNAVKYNHDLVAADYDNDVINESHPIRAGYSTGLQWLGFSVPTGSRVLDLGSGTGNTILSIPTDCRVVAVDISTKMLKVARTKLSSRIISYVVSDILEFFESPSTRNFDIVMSSYAIHHLTNDEKVVLFSCIKSILHPGGRAVFVDLMYNNESERKRLIEKYCDNIEVTGSIEEEFYWNVDSSVKKLVELGFIVTAWQFSDLSWGILAEYKHTSL